MFQIDPFSGVIRTALPLRQDFYNVTIMARDSGVPSLSGMALLSVTVDTGSGNQPVFDKQNYSFSLYEISPVGMLVGSVKASRIGMDVFYTVQLQDPSLPFRVNRTTGAIVLTKPLDREKTDSILFSVVATSDDGRSSVAPIRVLVTDINDNKPVFKKSLYVINVTENTPGPREILRIYPEDKDAGRNKRLVGVRLSNPGCDILRASLSNQVVVITLMKSVDYEVTKNISCILSISDDGIPRLTSSTIVLLQVTNIALL